MHSQDLMSKCNPTRCKGSRSERAAAPRSKLTCFFFPPPRVYLSFSSAGLPGGSKTEGWTVWFLLRRQPGEVPSFQFSLTQPRVSLVFYNLSQEGFSWKMGKCTHKKTASAARPSFHGPYFPAKQPPDNCLTSCQTFLCCLPR